MSDSTPLASVSSLATSPEPDEAPLVQAAVGGDRGALDGLVRRHQGFIYALALRMLYSPDDAADATQEILVRIVTNLSSFRGASAFRTWAYRIAVRHLLAVKKGRVEAVVHDFQCFAACLDATPDLDLPDAASLPVDVRLVVEEAKVGCLTAMLLCLDREHRMAFALGELFEASDGVMAEVLETSREVARQRLSRARRQLREFLTGRCSLVAGAGACRCARKTAGFIRQGIVDPEHLRFKDLFIDEARASSAQGAQAMEKYVEQAYSALLRTQPVAGSADFAAILRTLFERPEVRRTLGLGH